MNGQSRKLRVPILFAFGLALSLGAIFSLAYAQSTTSQQHGMGRTMGMNAQQPPAGEKDGSAMQGCAMGQSSGNMSGGMIGGMMDRMMGGQAHGMVGGMMRGMMGRMMGGQAHGMMGGMIGRMMGGRMYGTMSGMHTAGLLAFAEELGPTEDQVNRINELQHDNGCNMAGETTGEATEFCHSGHHTSHPL